MPHFVLDTNVIISAHLFKSSPIRSAYDIAFERGVVIRSEETMAELVETLMRPKFDRYVSAAWRSEALDEFGRRSLLIRGVEEIRACRDPKDDKFLSLAVAVDADCIISGDGDLLALHPFRGTSILKPSDFLTSAFIRR